MKKIIFLYSFLLIFPFCYGQKIKKIKQKKVAQIIQTLTSDDMEGRQVFTEGIEKAADFISSEFEKAGLQPFQGASSFRQEFSLMEFNTKSIRVSLNGNEVDEDKSLLLANGAKLNWKKTDDVEIIQVKEGDDIRAFLNKTLTESASKGQLIVMHPSFENMFGRLGQILGRFNRGVDAGKNPAKVFVLSAEVNVSDFEVDASVNIVKKPLANIVGVIPGKKQDEMVLFSGHYDHLGISRAIEGDSIYNGANDDASGTTAVISLAHYYSKMPQPERTLVFVAFTAEEIGLIGSKYFSEGLDPEKIVAMVNMELIGVVGEDGPSKAFITGFEKSNFGKLMQEAVKGTKYTFTEDPYPNMNLFYRSDNATLARLGVPAHTFSSAPMNSPDSRYHKPSDDFESLDMAHLTDLIQGIALGTHGVVYGTITPSRVDPANVR